MNVPTSGGMGVVLAIRLGEGKPDADMTVCVDADKESAELLEGAIELAIAELIGELGIAVDTDELGNDLPIAVERKLEDELASELAEDSIAVGIMLEDVADAVEVVSPVVATAVDDKIFAFDDVAKAVNGAADVANAVDDRLLEDVVANAAEDTLDKAWLMMIGTNTFPAAVWKFAYYLLISPTTFKK